MRVSGNMAEQEYIPVGCVPPAHYCTARGSPWQRSSRQRPLDIAPSGQRPPGQRPSREKPPQTETPRQRNPRERSRDRDPPGQRLPRQRPPRQRLKTPPPWTEWHTSVKTSPCRNFIAGGNSRLAPPPALWGWCLPNPGKSWIPHNLPPVQLQ